MPRPTVVLNVFSSVDGRMTTAPGRNVNEWTADGLDGEANRLAHALYDELSCDALISGSESILVFGNHWIDLVNPIPMPRAMKTFVVVDGRGRIDWAYTDGLVVITRTDVDQSYIQQLKEKDVHYIQTGVSPHVNLAEALDALHKLGIRKLGLSGGGTLNGAFLRAGLIDEVSIFISPVIVGGKNTPTLFDCADATGIDELLPLDLVETSVVGRDTVWNHYRVRHKPASSRG